MSATAKAAPAPAKSRGARRLSLDTRWVLSLFGLFLAEMLYFNFGISTFWGGGWGGSYSMLGYTTNFLYGSMVTLGIMFVIFAGDIDLSVGAMASFSGIMMAELHLGGVNQVLAIVLAIACCASIGLLQGIIITRFKLESLLVTLASQFILVSANVAWEGAVPPYNLPSGFDTVLGTGTISGTIKIPNQLIWFGILAVLATLIVHRTRFGRQLVLVGHNRDAAAYAGVRVSVTRIKAFVLSATFAAFAGICLAATYSTARDSVGPTLLLPAVTAVVLGGVDIFGGAGLVPGVIIATFVLGWLTPGLNQNGVSDTWVLIAEGVLLLGSLTVKGMVDRRQTGVSFFDRLRERFGGTTGVPGAPSLPEGDVNVA